MLRITPFDSSHAARAPMDAQRARAWSAGDAGAERAAPGANGRAERILGPSFGVARMIGLYRDNEAPYAPPALSRYHFVV